MDIRTAAKWEAKSAYHVEQIDRDIAAIARGLEQGDSFADVRDRCIGLAKEALNLADYLHEQELYHVRKFMEAEVERYNGPADDIHRRG